MRLLPNYMNTDAGNHTRDGFFDTATRTLYAIREKQADEGDESEIRWVTRWDVCAFTTPGEDAAPLAFLSRDFKTFDEALTELDRIAALIEGKAPAQGWVSGAPPQDGKTYVVAYDHDEMRPGVARWVDGEFEDDSGQPYGDIRYHLPTPIVLP